MLDIGCETHGFGKHFSSWYSRCHCVLAFSCVLQCFLHSWASKISVIFLQFSWNMQVLAHFCALFFLPPRTVIQTGQSHSRLWQSFETSWFQCSPISIARQVTGRRSYNVSGTPDKLLDEDLTTYQERLTSYWTKILQRIRNAWQVTGRRSYNVSGTPDKLLDEDLTMYQERLTSYWTKILQRIRKAWQVTGRRPYNVAGTPDKLLDEDLTTYQERLTSYWTKILQRIRNAWQVTGRRSYNVSGTPDKLLDEDLTT